MKIQTFDSYPRKDGRKGIRNLILVAYTVECAHHVAREIVYPFRVHGVNLIGFGGCAPNAYANDMMKKLCTHPNVGAVLLISLGCENMDKLAIMRQVRESGRPVHLLTIQKTGGTRQTIAEGQKWVRQELSMLQQAKKVAMSLEEIIVGTICGGSDATSGLTANPAIGKAFDILVSSGATAIFEETGELIGCESSMCERTLNNHVRDDIMSTMRKTVSYYQHMGYSSFSVGNSDGGLSTIEEKSLGAYSKSGTAPITGLLKPGELPSEKGLYLLDVIPDGDPRFGWPNINDNAEIVELIACGSHVILFSTGRGSVVGSAISPVIKVCANPETYDRMREDMDINAGKILKGDATLEEVGEEICSWVYEVVSGKQTASEALGHQEFVLTYKQFDEREPACLVR
ncbi:MAG: UxaA family hydrolase [Cyclobacteriaceae bacterium]